MWISAFAGMALAYSENKLGAEYGEKYPSAPKGPMLYIEKGFGSKRLACVYAAVCLCSAIFMGSMSQSGAFADALSAQTGLPRYLSSAAAAILTGAVLFSSKRATEGVMKLSAKLVPIMGILYTAGCVLLLAVTKSNVCGAFREIFSCALTPSAAAGGAVGITVRRAVSTGLRRGIFSNEAGIGSSVLVHSEADFGGMGGAGGISRHHCMLHTYCACCYLHGRSGWRRCFGGFFGGSGTNGRHVRMRLRMPVCMGIGAWLELLR